jgi:hypothetical protein
MAERSGASERQLNPFSGSQLIPQLFVSVFRNTFVEHQSLLEGGTLEFDMGPRPNPNWGGDGFGKPF